MLVFAAPGRLPYLYPLGQFAPLVHSGKALQSGEDEHKLHAHTRTHAHTRKESHRQLKIE